MTFRSYTTCVDRATYEEPNFSFEEFAAAAGALLAVPTFGISLVVSVAAAMSVLEKATDYMLHGKLVCLGEDECVLGRISSFETVADKSFPDSIDNDFSINLVLAPNALEEFLGHPGPDNYTRVVTDVRAGTQGRLITMQKKMPKPREAKPSDPHYAPMYNDFQFPKYGVPPVYAKKPPTGGKGGPGPKPDPKKYPPAPPTWQVPVFHCECEGTRIHDVATTLEDIGSLGTGGGLCRVEIFGIPVGKALCAIVSAVLVPIVLIAVGVAWANADDGNPDDARTDPQAGELALGDSVLIRGRWVFDAGHTGWNEFHPVRSIQKVPPAPTQATAYERYHAQWCTLSSEAPPRGDTKPTATQAAVLAEQLLPENQWLVHPAIDGCQPHRTPPVIR